MTTVREGIEQAVLISIGAAAITRERAEAAVADLVRRGQIGGEEGRKVVDRLMENVRRGGPGEGGGPAAGLVNRLEGGVQGVLREVGVVTGAEVDDLRLRLSELEHRIALLERARDAAASGPAEAPAPPPAPDDTEGGTPAV